jgi:hypothetical protein
MKRYIKKNESLPYPIDVVEIYEYFPPAWGPTKRAFYEAGPELPFCLHRTLPDADVPKAMKDCLISEDNI